MPNKLLTPEQTSEQIFGIWEKHMRPYAEKRRKEGATEEELVEEANIALACVFGGLWVGLDA